MRLALAQEGSFIIECLSSGGGGCGRGGLGLGVVVAGVTNCGEPLEEANAPKEEGVLRRY